jgi:hypothetical protein
VPALEKCIILFRAINTAEEASVNSQFTQCRSAEFRVLQSRVHVHTRVREGRARVSPGALRSMPTNKKVKSDKPKREKAKADGDDDDDDDDDDQEEEEEVESEAKRMKREKGKRSFLMMIRQLLALVTFGMVLSKQPFMVRPRESGKNAFKMKPLDVAIAGAVHWAATSPMVLKNPKYAEYINMTARALLTPHEYVSAQQSKRAMPAEQTINGAYEKTEKVFQRTVDKDTNVLEMLKLPLMAPNMVLLGSYVLILGSILSVLSGSIFEYVVITGCVLVLQGSRAFGMEPQPELYVAGGAAVLGLLAMEASAPKAEPKKRKKK